MRIGIPAQRPAVAWAFVAVIAVGIAVAGWVHWRGEPPAEVLRDC
ncbi:MAG: hypothetical protein ACXWZX_10250 [Mycobacterium sp.]